MAVSALELDSAVNGAPAKDDLWLPSIYYAKFSLTVLYYVLDSTVVLNLCC